MQIFWAIIMYFSAYNYLYAFIFDFYTMKNMIVILVKVFWRVKSVLVFAFHILFVTLHSEYPIARYK